MEHFIRKSKERGLTKTSWLESFHTFSFGEYFDPEYTHFGILRVLNEDYVYPQKGFHAHGHKDIEIISYVIEGSLAHRDNLGFKKTLSKGDIQYISAGKGILHSERNPEQEKKTHFLQIWVTPKEKGLSPQYQYRHIKEEEGQGTPLLLFSVNGRENSIPIHQDIDISLLRLSQGKNYQFSQPIYKMCWTQVVSGSLKVQGIEAEPGDGVGIKGHGEIHFEATEDCEVWIFSMRHKHEI